MPNDSCRRSIDALRYLEADGQSQIFNCGYSQGYSVRQMLEKMKEISGVDFAVFATERRAGDPACVIASSDRIRQVLGWQPRYNDLDVIVSTAFAWEKRLAQISLLHQISTEKVEIPKLQNQLQVQQV